MTKQALPSLVKEYKILLNGRLEDSSDGERFDRKSPAHDVQVGTYPAATPEDMDSAVEAAKAAFDSGVWSEAPGTDRARALRKVAELIERDLEQLALIETLESGKPITQSRSEMEAVAELWWYAATLSQHAEGSVNTDLGSEYLGLSVREPVGVVGMITPWNFPLLIASQKLPFALAVGCTAVLKPSQLTPGTSLHLGELINEAGLPDGVVNVISGQGKIGARLTAHKKVDMVSFTGSTQVGHAVASSALADFKRVSLELGGKNPMVVMADADFEAAADAAVFGFTFNQGECCNSASRLLIHEDIADAFEQRVVELVGQVPVGDPLDPETKIGAIASEEQLARIEEMVQSGIDSGAALRCGGERLSTDVGRFYNTTVFTGVERDAEIAHEEIFGPVLSTIRFKDLDDALKLTNNSQYGLSAGIWTSDLDAGWAFARKAKVGTVWLNCWMDGFPELSFGGRKHSGIGRELGKHAIEEFTELKTVTARFGQREMWVPNS